MSELELVNLASLADVINTELRECGRFDLQIQQPEEDFRPFVRALVDAARHQTTFILRASLEEAKMNYGAALSLGQQHLTRAEAAEAERDAAVADNAALLAGVMEFYPANDIEEPTCRGVPEYTSTYGRVYPGHEPTIRCPACNNGWEVGTEKEHKLWTLLRQPHPGAGLLESLRNEVERLREEVRRGTSDWVNLIEALRVKDEALRALSATVAGFGGRLIYHDDPRMTRALAEIDAALSTTPAPAGGRVARLVGAARVVFEPRYGLAARHRGDGGFEYYIAPATDIDALRQALAEFGEVNGAGRSSRGR